MSDMIRILSYNIFWRAMTNSETATDTTNKERNQICKTDPNKANGSVTVCLTNVVKFVNNNGPYDFVGFQEATNWKTIQEKSPYLANMNTCSIKFGDPILDTTYKENMVIFYDGDKYILDSGTNIIKGFLQDAGRPFIIMFFSDNLCVINMHGGHYANKTADYKNNGDLNKLFTEYLPKFINKFEKTEIYNKINSYNLIIMGDMNNDLPKSVIIGNRKLFGINKKATCCDRKLLNTGLSRPYDHIISTYKQIKYVNFDDFKVPASDHLPVIVEIKTDLNIDYHQKYLEYKKKYLELKNK